MLIGCEPYSWDSASITSMYSNQHFHLLCCLFVIFLAHYFPLIILYLVIIHLWFGCSCCEKTTDQQNGSPGKLFQNELIVDSTKYYYIYIPLCHFGIRGEPDTYNHNILIGHPCNNSVPCPLQCRSAI